MCVGMRKGTQNLSFVILVGFTFSIVVVKEKGPTQILIFHGSV